MGKSQKNEKVKELVLARPNYYQGVLQLRTHNSDIIDFIYAQVDKAGDVAITKQAKMPDGMDMYMTSQAFLRKLGKKLRESFGGEMRTSARLHTKIKGKEVYRVTVLYRPWGFKRGDVINVRGEQVKITYFGNKVFAKHLKTGKKITIRHEDLPKFGE